MKTTKRYINPNVRNISVTDFVFDFAGYGRYNVTYVSPKTGKRWTAHVTDMSLIDNTKGTECPKRADLEKLKRVCKG
ncbi:MAG: hypothetical protein LBQ73_05785 [Tannerellaceae bacterium]|jgi:hypothetical protein|nr:hypothetical protein [Tannerellaceae bacterium]